MTEERQQQAPHKDAPDSPGTPTPPPQEAPVASAQAETTAPIAQAPGAEQPQASAKPSTPFPAMALVTLEENPKGPGKFVRIELDRTPPKTLKSDPD
jgi:hypothetical protein